VKPTLDTGLNTNNFKPKFEPKGEIYDRIKKRYVADLFLSFLHFGEVQSSSSFVCCSFPLVCLFVAISTLRDMIQAAASQEESIYQLSQLNFDDSTQETMSTVRPLLLYREATLLVRFMFISLLFFLQMSSVDDFYNEVLFCASLSLRSSSRINCVCLCVFLWFCFPVQWL
jgi:hypothetical protein